MGCARAEDTWLRPSYCPWGASGGHTNPGAAVAGDRHRCWGSGWVIFSHGGGPRRLINSTPCVNTSSHAVPKARACPPCTPCGCHGAGTSQARASPALPAPLQKSCGAGGVGGERLSSATPPPSTGTQLGPCRPVPCLVQTEQPVGLAVHVGRLRACDTGTPTQGPTQVSPATALRKLTC